MIRDGSDQGEVHRRGMIGEECEEESDHEERNGGDRGEDFPLPWSEEKDGD